MRQERMQSGQLCWTAGVRGAKLVYNEAMLNALLDGIRSAVRSVMQKVAQALHKLTGGKLSPNAATLAGLIAHVPIAWLIATRHPLKAALLLVIFGLFDTLDGELARLQGRASPAGMLLDAVTDRMKEILLYCGIAYFFITLGYPRTAVWVVAACGASLLVSYVKAKGEVAVKDSKLSPNAINKLFQDGLMRYEIRMFLIFVGLVTALLPEMVMLIAVLSTFTAISRLINISRRLM
jgi:CDP-diacylglycerol--glycerol-3-phosphate 3-phosphatidyltransferase